MATNNNLDPKETLEKTYRKHQHQQPLSNGFSMGKHHSTFKRGPNAVRHIQQPTRGRGVK